MNKEQLKSIIDLVIDKYTVTVCGYYNDSYRISEIISEIEELTKDLTETLFLFINENK